MIIIDIFCTNGVESHKILASAFCRTLDSVQIILHSKEHEGIMVPWWSGKQSFWGTLSILKRRSAGTSCSWRNGSIAAAKPNLENRQSDLGTRKRHVHTSMASDDNMITFWFWAFLAVFILPSGSFIQERIQAVKHSIACQHHSTLFSGSLRLRPQPCCRHYSQLQRVCARSFISLDIFLNFREASRNTRTFS